MAPCAFASDVHLSDPWSRANTFALLQLITTIIIAMIGGIFWVAKQYSMCKMKPTDPYTHK